MSLSIYAVDSFHILITVIILICNCEGQSEHNEEEFVLATLNDTTNGQITADSLIKPTEEIHQEQEAETTDHTNQHSNKPKRRRKRKSKRPSSLNTGFTNPISKDHERTLKSVTAVGRVRYYDFPTGKHRNQKKYVDFKPFNSQPHPDVQLRDVLSSGIGVLFTASSVLQNEVPKLVYPTSKPYKVPNVIHPTGEDGSIILTTLVKTVKKRPTNKVKYPTSRKPKGKKKLDKKVHISGTQYYIHGGSATYIMSNGTLIEAGHSSTTKAGSGGQFNDEYGSGGEQSDVQSTSATSPSTKCSTVVPLPDLDSGFVPTSEETDENKHNEFMDDEDALIDKIKNSNYIPPDRRSTPRHYIDDV